MRRTYWLLKLLPGPRLGALKFLGQLDYLNNKLVHPNGRLGCFVEITEGFPVTIDGLHGFDELVVVVGHHAELRVESGQSGVVVQRGFIDGDDFKGSSEDDAVEELGLAFHAGSLVHGKEPFVFLVGEIEGIVLPARVGQHFAAPLVFNFGSVVHILKRFGETIPVRLGSTGYRPGNFRDTFQPLKSISKGESTTCSMLRA